MIESKLILSMILTFNIRAPSVAGTGLLLAVMHLKGYFCLAMKVLFLLCVDRFAKLCTQALRYSTRS